MSPMRRSAQSAKAFGPMRWTRSGPRLSGPRARKWSASASDLCKANKRAGGSLRRPSYFWSATAGLAAIAHEAQQELEHVDEVEIEGQRPHDHGLAHHVRARD